MSFFTHSLGSRNFWANLLGNVLEHYDSALFGLLAPLLAPLFFLDTPPLPALVATYALMPLGLLARPLGAWIFGSMGDRLGRRPALFFSMMGMALTTVAMGCLPTGETLGKGAFVLLACCRLLQNFFAAGETPGGALLLLEQTPEEKRSLMSSLYDGASIIGVLLASFGVWLVGFHPWGWRALFWLGALTGAVGIFLRRYCVESTEYLNDPSVAFSFSLRQYWQERLSLLSIVLATGFSYAIYTVPFVLFNGYLPLITQVSQKEAAILTLLLLVLDLCLLPLFGFFAMRFSKETLMRSAAFAGATMAIPLFAFLAGGSWMHCAAVGLFFVGIGTAFAAPYYHWVQEIVPVHKRYRLIAMGKALGSQLIGAPTASLILWLYRKTESPYWPASYLVLAALAALGAIAVAVKKRQEPAVIDKAELF